MAAFLSLWMWDSDDMVVSSCLGRCWLRWLAVVSCVLTAMLPVGLMAASEGLAQGGGPPPFKNRGLAIVNGGVLWFDEGTLLLEGPHLGVRRLWASSLFEDEFSSSATAVALGTQLASVLPRRLSAIAQPPRLSGRGCTWWEPSENFVVVEDELVAAGECQEVTEHPRAKPLYIRNLRGGRWKVLRWLAGASGTALAAEGALLAIGAQRSDRRMTVSILDLSTGATQASFDTPVGRMAFASPRRLVVEIPDRVATNEGRRRVSLRLYSTRRNYLANLGAVTEPLISGLHIVAYENGTLSVRSVAGGPPRPVVGFNRSTRGLKAFALRWPKLVVSETTSKPLLPSEVRCYSGSYGPSSKPFLATFDLARVEPFDAPPVIVNVEPTVPLTKCGPAPPAAPRGEALTWVGLQARDEFGHDFDSGLCLFGECDALSGP
jgi:hypothetical protein